jgi:hypothetical protein
VGTPGLSRRDEGRKHMRLIKRLAIAAGSLMALVLAGGAHFKA